MDNNEIRELEAQRRCLVNDFLAMTNQFPAIKYNETVRQINQKRQYQLPRTDPLLVFPSELWIECLLYVITDDPDWIYTALLVCRRWWQKILDVPTLWRYICISSAELDVPKKIATSIFLSHDLPLSITFILTHTDASYEGIIDIRPFFAVKERIREIALEVDSLLTSSSLRWSILERIPFLSQFDMLSNLENLSIYSRSGLKFPSRRISAVSPMPLPHLKSITGYIIDTETLNSVQSPHLVEAEVECELNELMSYMAKVPKLQSLAVQMAGVAQVLCIGEAQENYIRNCQLRKLSISVSDFNLIGDHPILSIKTLQELQLTLEFEYLPEILNNICHLDSLRRLRFNLHGLYPDDPQIPPITKVLNNLFSVSIEVNVWRERVLVSQGLRAIIDSLLDSLVLLAPNVRDMNISSTNPLPWSTVLQSVQRLAKMENLNLKDSSEGRTMGRSRFQFPSLLHLQIQSESSLVNIFRGIHAPKLQTMQVDCPLSGLSTRLETPCLRSLRISTDSMSLLHSLDIASLRSLEWGCNRQYNSTNSLDMNDILQIESLEELVLLDGYWNREHEMMLMFLIQNPHLLPNLQTLRFNYYPSFALLLRFLFRRNTLINAQDPNVTQISVIKLPGLPAYSILQPLTRLLGGYWVTPSDFLTADYVDQGFREVSRCDQCAFAGLKCINDTLHKSMGSTEPDVLKDLEMTDDRSQHFYRQDVWDNVDKWLEEWQNIRDMGRPRLQKQKRGNSRLSTCALHLNPNLQTVTKDTLGEI